MIRITDTMATPPGGWRYEQPETGYVMRSGSLRGLVALVRAHREGNGLTVGDPEQDIHEWLCAMHPEICRRETAIIEKPGIGFSDVQAFVATVTELIKRKGDRSFVGKDEAERRASVCITCPHNKSLPGCGPCKGIASLVTLNRETSKDDSLKQCAICGCFLATKVHLDRDLIRETQAKDYVFPDWCWLSKEKG